jgi:hypothetical protein
MKRQPPCLLLACRLRLSLRWRLRILNRIVRNRRALPRRSSCLCCTLPPPSFGPYFPSIQRNGVYRGVRNASVLDCSSSVPRRRGRAPSLRHIFPDAQALASWAHGTAEGGCPYANFSAGCGVVLRSVESLGPKRRSPRSRLRPATFEFCRPWCGLARLHDYGMGRRGADWPLVAAS